MHTMMTDKKLIHRCGFAFFVILVPEKGVLKSHNIIIFFFS